MTDPTLIARVAVLGVRTVLGVAALGAALCAPGALAQKRIFIGPDDHTDLFWAQSLQAYEQSFLRTLDHSAIFLLIAGGKLVNRIGTPLWFSNTNTTWSFTRHHIF